MTEKNGHILVVDDNKMNRVKLTLTLEHEGHTVALAEDGRKALDMLQEDAFDVVLLDLMMPDIDGFEVLKCIKNDPKLREIPVIVISALDDLDGVVRCIEMGAEDYLPKSFNPVLLNARLTSSLQKKKLRDLERKYYLQEVKLHQNEKLALLGKLSAGMAHELNNPSASVQRGAQQLHNTFGLLQQSYLELNKTKLSDSQIDVMLKIDGLARERARAPEYLDSITRNDRDSDMETYLDDLGVENAWEVAPTLVELGFATTELQPLADALPGDQLPLAIDWLCSSATIYTLTEQIDQGAERMSEIVKALKNYTYMDQAPIQNVDIHSGLDSTLVILRSKLAAGVVVRRSFAEDLPRIEAYGSELNQVWTNIIDNAIDAMDGKGEIILRTRYQSPWVIVEIEDNGPGIPEEIQSQIFNPFITTKLPGKGTGLGLNISHNIIVQKHNGIIGVTSRPGKTCFEIKLPLQLQTLETVEA